MPDFPFFKQLDPMDCGPSCLRMVGKYFGKSYTLQFLRSKSFITKSGASMLAISDAVDTVLRFDEATTVSHFLFLRLKVALHSF